MLTRQAPLGLSLTLVLLLPALAAAQTGVISGSVDDAVDNRPLANATVEIRGPDAQPIVVLTDEQGRFRREVAPGTYTLIVGLFGHETVRLPPVVVRAGETIELRIPLAPKALLLNPLVVSVSRQEEKALDAPAAISIAWRESVEERVAFTPVEHIQTLPGVDAATTGMQRTTVVARGFNDVFSTALLFLTDYRYANIPSNRLNASYMIPTTDLDIDRIEVSLGPGSALYGPNATNGVMHIITKSPIDDPGSSVSLAVGERSIFQGMFRTAHALNDRLGFKVSGQYFRGDDWKWTDPVEEELRAADPSNPLIGARDFLAERWSGEARVDYRPGEDTEWITSAGINMTLNNIEVSGAGRSLVDGWRYSYVQTRLRKGRFFAQTFFNFSDAGDSRFLRTGLPAVDNSRMLVAQVQHGADIGNRVTAIYGLDLQRTDTRTGGTITGRFENDDIVDEAGAYIHTVVALTDKLEAVGALRVDYHNRLEDPVFSPRAALVFKPQTGHTLRATFNRAFRTPSVLDLFLDLKAGNIPITDDISYDLRTIGVAETGYTFDQCPGGFMSLCMRVPGGAEPIPADATLAWDQLIAALAPQLAPLLPNPGSEVGTVLRRLNPEGLAIGDPFPIDPVGPQDIEPLRPTITNTLELGYKGLWADRLLLSANVYYTTLRDFVGPITVETPNVFLDPASTAAYVTDRLAPLVAAGAIEPSDVEALIGGLVAIPVGTVSPSQWDAPDILLTYRNFGDVDLWGFELAGQFLATDELSFAGSLSYTSERCFDFDGDGLCFSARDRALNAPSLKGHVSSRYRDPSLGFFAEGGVRFINGFPQSTGVFVGEIDGYALVDATLGYQLPQLPGTRITLTASNLFDNRHREFIGAPELGRLLILRLRYDF